ncbi:MAG: bifunctional non-ous end joining protein LigD [Pseudonocardiales bacterium]|nr:bifunctional non-ous end joining protein LigD [Pseudonocardiales bacterium]
MLATAANTLPRGPGWAFEFKWDGVRALLEVSEAAVTLHSRAGNEITAAYPELVAGAAGSGDVLLDGEIVAFVDGRPSFDALQTRMHVRGAGDARRLAHERPVTFIAFDVLRLHGVDLMARPYGERRATLERWAGERPGWTVSPSFDDGPATEAAAREHGLEGVVAKRIDSRYRAGLRTPEWVKLRFERAGDFVVVGWEAARDRPGELSSVLLGCYADGVLTYVGKAGSGLTTATARSLQDALTPCGACALPETPPASPGRVVTWVRPDVVVEVAFASWTDERRLRHPVFRAIRLDKDADEACGDA